MPELILNLLLACIGLGTTWFIWWIKNDAEKKKRIADEDAKIETFSNADDIMRNDK